MSLEVPGLGSAARQIPIDAWKELAVRNGGAVTIEVLLKALPFKPIVSSTQWNLAWGKNIVVPRPRYHNEVVESILRKQLNPKAKPFVPSDKKNKTTYLN